MISFRREELNTLNQYYSDPNAQLVILYGQKFVGKKNLIDLFLEDKTSVFFKAVNATEREQRYLWNRQLLMENDTTDYPSFLSLFEQVLQQNVSYGKIVFVIDQFHLLLKAGMTFWTEMLSLMETHPDVMFLLNSSAIGFIENTFVSKIGRTALKINGFLKIRPLPYIAVREVFYNYSPDECLQLYSILGGYPVLWQYFDRMLSVRENVIREMLDENSGLRSAGMQLLQDELREYGVYSTILASLAEGREKLNEIYAHTEFSRAKISVYLKNLIELELVEKVFSVDTEGRENTQKGIYRIAHPFIRFYYKYLYPNEILLEQMKPDTFYEKQIQKTWKHYVEESFEDILIQYFEKRNRENKLPASFPRIGRWNGKAGRIPVLAMNESEACLIALCSYEKPIMSYQDYEWLTYLSEQAAVQPDYCYLFALHGFDERILLEERTRTNLKTVLLEDF